ncbi:Uncharacterized conserved protein, DUF1330 family [Roseateles sp. YR242]|uniref:DUF1330 domain-containing protein n=1 Tax=Roseateles sp. YR242 TaxID=1855305 RepID=UPI0008C69B99|nr:DUF1330 domain-containing protein [Roseateles sp. YR242]SEL60608.1 Uncharacterized conserved protein, DUF1330 family [Roseateles sp. YR242]
MPAFIIIDVTVTDADKMAAYREWSTKAMKEHGAEVLVRGGEIEVLEGDWAPSRLVVLKFTDRDAAKGFYHSETYLRARQLRENAGIVRMVVVDGA